MSDPDGLDALERFDRLRDCADGCPHCGADWPREVCQRHGWCLLTPLQRARLDPHPAPEPEDGAE